MNIDARETAQHLTFARLFSLFTEKVRYRGFTSQLFMILNVS